MPRRCASITTSLPSSPPPRSIIFFADAVLAVPNAVISDPFELIKIVRYTKKALCQISPRIERISPFDFRTDTARISSKTMEARNVPGVYVTRRGIDVIKALGGFKLHWAFASGQACGEAL
ncbi:NAD(P)/FAD-dependent oxidoreductase [Pseudodesulfovibrio sp. 9FUS]|uniref:NAD(P)/FAD-dependent oxidoreductase n=1 Tax=Pseudodesulfovibrio karagichevae TaxID=3239305 RepID=A0ABV4K6F8_9BACT